jgi:hypothetical protein
MCWTALHRFYTATRMPIEIKSAPSEGEPLYKEIYDVQINSVTSSVVDKMWEWQCAPDLDPEPGEHNPYAPSLGKRTSNEWGARVKPSLDNSKPVTLTLIAESNDRNAFDLPHHHRVIAYAYETTTLSDEKSAVEIFIYDPVYPNDNDVRLTFYTGNPGHSIQLTHNRGDVYHGFFLDDADRNYAFSDRAYVAIVQCVPNKIISMDRAIYDLQFRWGCRFIPYFVIQVEGENWKYNGDAGDDNAAKFKYDPPDADHKQCPTRIGSMTVPLQLPRTSCNVAVRLLDADPFTTSIDVDAEPSFICYPYVRKRVDSEKLIVCDSAIQDTDLFIKVEKPTEAEILQVDTNPFKWVEMLFPPGPSGGYKQPDAQDPFRGVSIAPIDIKRLGNIKVPVFGNFVERNLAPPTTTSGEVTIFDGRPVPVKQTLAPLNSTAQKIFDGFTNNPSDYDRNIAVEFIYKSVDYFGASADGSVLFFGQSIIHTAGAAAVSFWTPEGFKMVGAIIRKLAAMGLLAFVTALEEPQPPELNPLLKVIESDPRIQAEIDQILKELWSSKAIWNEIWKRQSEISMQESRAKMLGIGKLAKPGETLAATKRIIDARNIAYNDVLVNTFAKHLTDRLRKDRSVLKKLKPV